MAQMLLGPSSPDCITGMFEILNRGMDNAVGFYLSNPRTFFALIFAFIFIVYYLREVVRVCLYVFTSLCLYIKI